MIAEPVLAAADAGRIAAIRRQHDPNAGRIGPHFTLVFGIGPEAEPDLAGRLREAAARTPPFGFVLRSADVLPGLGDDRRYAVLVPDEGYDALVRLHRALNDPPAGAPAFEPHLTVGQSTDGDAMQALARRLARDSLAIEGRIDRLRLLRSASTALEPVLEVSLS